MKKYGFKTQEFTASEVVDHAFTEFTIDVAAQKVANNVDGLKSIHRRILWAIRGNNSWLNLNTFVGKVIEIHPVGDKSIDEACIRAMQEFSIGLPLLSPKGNAGDYSSEDAGADRYLKVKISPIAHDLFFEGVDIHTLPMKETEDFMGVEPIYFIPRLPTALLFNSLTLGVGFKSEIFPLHLDNVCILVQKYIESMTKNIPLDINKIAHCLVPEFPIKNYIRNTDQLIKSYTNGNFTPQVLVDGCIDVTPNTIVIKTIPFGSRFEAVEIKLRDMLQNKKSWLSELCVGYANLVELTTEGALTITFKRGVDTLDVVQRLSKELQISRGLRAIPKYTNRHGLLKEYNPIELLRLWYSVRKESIIGGIKSNQIANTKAILEKRTKLLVHDKWDLVLSIVRNPNLNVSQVINGLMETFDLSYYQSKILSNSPIIAANKQSRSELEHDIKNLEHKEQNLHETLQSVDDLIYRDVEYIRKKYHSPRMTKIDAYIGYISIDNKHIIQFDSIDEVYQLLTMYPTAKVYFYSDPKRITAQHAIFNNTLVSPKCKLSKYVEGQAILDIYDNDVYTFSVNESDGTAYILDGLQLHRESGENILIPVGKNFTGIHADGTVVALSLADFKTRKKANAKGTKTKIIYAFPANLNNCTIVYMNTVDPTTLHFCPINTSTTMKIPMSVMGKTEFIGIISNKSKLPIMLNLPEWNSTKSRYLTINALKDSSIGDWSSQYIQVPLTRTMKKDPELRSSIMI